jgi:hypothetical protein
MKSQKNIKIFFANIGTTPTICLNKFCHIVYQNGYKVLYVQDILLFVCLCLNYMNYCLMNNDCFVSYS